MNETKLTGAEQYVNETPGGWFEVEGVRGNNGEPVRWRLYRQALKAARDAYERNEPLYRKGDPVEIKEDVVLVQVAPPSDPESSREKILAFYEKNPTSTLQEAGDALGFSRQAAHQYVNALEEMGAIERGRTFTAVLLEDVLFGAKMVAVLTDAGEEKDVLVLNIQGLAEKENEHVG